VNFKIIFSASLLDIVRKGAIAPVLNKAPCHEEVKASGGITPVVLNLGSK
jgi:hypothetical protein